MLVPSHGDISVRRILFWFCFLLAIGVVWLRLRDHWVSEYIYWSNQSKGSLNCLGYMAVHGAGRVMFGRGNFEDAGFHFSHYTWEDRPMSPALIDWLFVHGDMEPRIEWRALGFGFVVGPDPHPP